MTGRRLRTDEEVERDLTETCELYRSIPHPPELAERIFTALGEYMNLPLSIRDPEQMREDIKAAIVLAEAHAFVDDPILPLVFWRALALVSAREHIVLQPGQMRKSRPLQ